MKLLEDFVLRTPLLPSESITDPWAAFKNSSLIQEAIYLSSPVLFERIQDVIKGAELRSEKVSRIEQSLRKYLIRLANRPTPFAINGLVSEGKFSNESNISVKDAPIERSVRYDMHFLCRFYDNMLKDQKVIMKLLWFSNNTLTNLNNKYSYIGYSLETGERVYQLSQVKADVTLESIIRLSKDGILVERLINDLTSKGFEADEVWAYILELIDSKLLVSELEPTVSGEFYEKKIAKFIWHHPEIYKPEYAVFAEVQKSLKQIKDFSDYARITQKLDEAGLKIQPPLHIDCYRPLEKNSLDRSVFKDFPAALRLCSYFARHVKNNAQTALNDFISEFQKRYEEQELPINFVLDPDISIGYPFSNERSLGDEISLGLIGRPETMHIYETRDRFQAVINKYYQCISQNKIEIEFTEDEYNSWAREITLPSSIITTIASLVHTQNGIEIVHSASEPLGASGVSRFSAINHKLFQATHAICTREQEHYSKENIIVAEVVFLPSERGSNVVAKPTLRQYEIPIVCQSSQPSEFVIPLSDITISVVSGTIRLKSKSKKAVIIPRFTSIFNPLHCQLPIFNFLLDLRYSVSTGGINWSWGFLAKMPFQPRVRYKNIILSKATWLIESGSLSHISIDDFKALRDYFASMRIPSQVMLSKGDDISMSLNLNDDNDIALFRDELKKYHKLQLSENLAADNGHVVKSARGSFKNEVMVHWDNLIPGPKLMVSGNSLQSKRQFVPGEEWIYVSLFCTQKNADLILGTTIKKIIDKLAQEKKLDSWFFIRYGDPRFHIRLRIKPRKQFRPEVDELVNKALLKLQKSGLTWDVKKEVYNRELNRYGDLNINATEKLFQADSQFIVNILPFFTSTQLSNIRWKIAILSIDSLFSDFRIDIQKRINILESLKRSFFIEQYVTTKHQQNWLKQNFRNKKNALEATITRKDADLSVVQACLTVRSQSLTKLSAIIQKNLAKNYFSIEDILPSYMHMMMNRLFVSQHRRQEMIIYDLMHQYYLTVKGRSLHS